MLAAAVVYGTSNVFAEDDNLYPQTMVQKIAERFGLDENDVEAVFDEMHAEHHAELQMRFEERLDKAVEDGLITEEQKQLILDKHEELQAERQANMESFRNLTPEERQEKMAAQKAELDNWAQENGIDLELLVGPGMMHGPAGMGHHFKGEF